MKTTTTEHKHSWQRYFDGWRCESCGKKTGYDYKHDPIEGQPHN